MQCAIQNADMVIRDYALNVNLKNKSFGPASLGDICGSCTVEGTVTLKLNYNFSVWYHFEYIFSHDEHWDLVGGLGIPAIQRRVSPVPLDGPSPVAWSWFFGPDRPSTPEGYPSRPVLCPAPCAGDMITWRAEFNGSLEGIPIHKTEEPDAPYIFTQPTDGELVFWGWDTCSQSVCKRQFDSWTYINENVAQLLPTSVPFQPTYTAVANFMGGTWTSPIEKVYVVNPQNLLLKAFDETNSCPHFRVTIWTTNCYWPIVLDLIPGQPFAF